MRQPARSNSAIVASCRLPFGIPSFSFFAITWPPQNLVTEIGLVKQLTVPSWHTSPSPRPPRGTAAHRCRNRSPRSHAQPVAAGLALHPQLLPRPAPEGHKAALQRLRIAHSFRKPSISISPVFASCTMPGTSPSILAKSIFVSSLCTHPSHLSLSYQSSRHSCDESEARSSLSVCLRTARSKKARSRCARQRAFRILVCVSLLRRTGHSRQHALAHGDGGARDAASKSSCSKILRASNARLTTRYAILAQSRASSWFFAVYGRRRAAHSRPSRSTDRRSRVDVIWSSAPTLTCGGNRRKLTRAVRYADPISASPHNPWPCRVLIWSKSITVS
jgi:hypothetical protein